MKEREIGRESEIEWESEIEREKEIERGREREREWYIEITHQASPSVSIFFSTYIQIIEKRLQLNKFCEIGASLITWRERLEVQKGVKEVVFKALYSNQDFLEFGY